MICLNEEPYVTKRLNFCHVFSIIFILAFLFFLLHPLELYFYQTDGNKTRSCCHVLSQFSNFVYGAKFRNE